MLMSKLSRKNIRHILPGGVGWFTGLLVFSILLTACGGGNGNTPPVLTPAASLAGFVTFTPEVPLDTPPADAFDGTPPSGVRYGARIVDPGDDIGSTTAPKPQSINENGHYEFRDLEENPLVYFNFKFTIAGDLEGNSSSRTPVSLNIPVSLLKGFLSSLSTTVSRPEPNALQVTYEYKGPDGSRSIRFMLNFATDIIRFDLDSDGLYDDLVALDINHDAIPDEHAPFLKNFNLNNLFNALGNITRTGANSVTVAGKTFMVWGSTNITSSINDEPLTMSELGVGTSASVTGMGWNSSNVALNIELAPKLAPSGAGFIVNRNGAIEEISGDAIKVDGTLFHSYAGAEIVDILGGKFKAADLSVGLNAVVTGVRAGNVITATKIVVAPDVIVPPQTIERSGTIESLTPADNPSVMVVGGIQFTLTPQTAVYDLTATHFSLSVLEVGQPVYVMGHKDNSGGWIADIIELKFQFTQPDVDGYEIVVLINSSNAMSEITGIIESLSPAVPTAVVLVSSYPPGPSDPECLADVYDELFWQGHILKGFPGFIEHYPRVENNDCLVHILIDDAFPETRAWIDLFFPTGIAGSEIFFDMVSLPPFYGTGAELEVAGALVEQLNSVIGNNPALVTIYISSDIDFMN